MTRGASDSPTRRVDRIGDINEAGLTTDAKRGSVLLTSR
jgi:hypothetical protein